MSKLGEVSRNSLFQPEAFFPMNQEARNEYFVNLPFNSSDALYNTDRQTSVPRQTFPR